MSAPLRPAATERGAHTAAVGCRQFSCSGLQDARELLGTSSNFGVAVSAEAETDHQPRGQQRKALRHHHSSKT